MKITHITVIGVLLWVVSFASMAQKLTINVTNIEQIKGNLVIELMDKKTFDEDSDDVDISIVIPVTSKEVVHEFNGIIDGEYAVFVYQDLNNNKELDFSVFSGPQEPVGASNNVQFSFLPPTWDEVKVSVSDRTPSINILLQH